jgi:hypothetical protein
MGIASEGSAAPFATKVTPQELGQIITLRKNLDLMEGLGKFAAQYLKLGWSLLALDARTGANLGVDFTLPPRDWSRCLMDESLKGAEVNLAVRTGSPSRLFVITVDSEAGGRQLDAFGPWRSPCIARNKTTREQHFYHLPSFWELSTASVSALKVLGEGAMALVPPSMEPDLEDTWHWWQAPWESPPCPPPPGLTHFLEKTGLLSTPELEGRPPLTWHEVLPRISGHKELLRALLVPQASLSRYYQQIITEALKAGVNDPKLLKTLLWHAPHGDAPQRPERWRGLLKVVTEVDRGRRGLSQAAASTPKEAENLPPQTLLHRLEKLAARTRELERQLAFLRPPAQRADSPPVTGPEPRGTTGPGAIPLWEEWLTLIRRPSLAEGEVTKFQHAVANFLKANPDLAADEGKLQMVLYSYANYVDIDPGNKGLSYEKKLAKAGDLARNLLNSLAF